MPKVSVEKIVQQGADFRTQVASAMKSGLPVALKFCQDVIEGNLVDVHVLRDGTIIEKPICIKDRLDAVKKYKELAIDKVLPDMRQVDVKTDVVSTREVLEEIARRRKAEADLEKTGKLKRVGRG